MSTVIHNKILIIEDEPGIANYLKTIVSAAGYDTIVTGAGKTALQMISSHCPDCVLLDLGLPDMDGSEIIRSMRSWTQTPIIVVSARCTEKDKAAALDNGADDYITKPFSPSELVARVKAHLSRYDRLKKGAVPERNSEINIRGLKIDKDARRVWVDGEEKQFTTKEYDLLLFLAEHPNRVYTKEEIFKNVWDMDSVGDIATVTVHIKKIREKIEYNTAKPQYIETIWGVGYRFKV